MFKLCFSLIKWIFVFILFYTSAGHLLAQQGAKPGDIYKEYAINLKTGNNWRVTDPSVTREDALVFLPNPVLNINIDDLDGAVRAEALMDIWGGHAGTSNKRFRFNNNEWIRILEIPTIAVRPECYMSQFNVIMELPLQHLQEGINTFEGTSGGQICYNYNWGQWGWWVMLVRIYYGPEKVHTKGSINYPPGGSIISDNPEILVHVENPDNVSQVQILGKYKGYDQKGQGYYHDWHLAYHGTVIEGHIGTAILSPFKHIWNTTWVPDQDPGDVSFVARIRGKNGVWYVTEIADSITLDRTGAPSVKLYTASEVPENFVVRRLGSGAANTKGCRIHISDLADAVEARLFHRTWNAADDDAARGTITFPLEVNGFGFKTFGKNHNYAISSVPVPVTSLVTGHNYVTYKSNTSHHGIEVLWPGPAIMVRYDHTHSSPPDSASDLSAYWGFNENDGNMAEDGSDYGNNLSLTTNAAWDEGKYGSSLYLPENSQSFAVIDNNLLKGEFPSVSAGALDASFTLTSWIKIIKPDADNRAVIMSKESQNKRGFVFEVRNGFLAGAISRDADKVTRTFDIPGEKTSLETHRWYHAAMTYEYVSDGNSVIKLFLDGREDFSVNTSTGPLQNNHEPLRIGAYLFNTNVKRYFMGWIDEVYVFNRVLSESEIIEIMNSENYLSTFNDFTDKTVSLSTYPNPFYQITGIRFHLSKPGHVLLKIYNLQGHIVKTLINNELPEGEHEIYYEPGEIPAGLYLASLVTGQSSESIRILYKGRK